ncbi:MAG TPA: thiamine pyrophosphate-binding protein [Thermoanaerobaculia bacterium]|nr:thiamine pyrophosphate-binding protein [Thermoanaerobaculia bacterium]
MTGGDRIAAVLARHGVRFVFTLCGGHISPILVGAKRLGIRVVDVRHEVDAVFAADAVARLSGVPGVAAVTAGPGATNTITAVKNAQLAQSPVVVLGGAAATLLKGRGALQDIDQMALMRPHVKWSAAARHVGELAPLLTRAFAEARAGVPGPVFLECPVDLLYEEQLVRQMYGAGAGGGGGIAGWAMRTYLRRHVDRLFRDVRRESSGGAGGPAAAPLAPLAPIPHPVPSPPQDHAAAAATARRLRRCRRPVLVVGSQAMLAATLGGETAAAEPAAASPDSAAAAESGGAAVDAALARAAELARAVAALGMPVYLAGGARGLLGAAHPLQRRHRRKEALREADLVLLAGIPCDFRLDYGRHIGRQAELVMVNRSAAELRQSRRPDLGVHADPGRFLCDLAGVAAGSGEAGWGGWEEWQAALRARDAEREEEIARQAAADPPDGFLNPLHLCREIDRLLAPESLLVADGGDFVATASYTVRPRGPLCWLDPGVFGTLGVGGGFALGAKLCRPQADVWILYGDGSAAYSLAEFDTFARHGLPVVAVVGNDAGWTQIAREQVEIFGDEVATVLARTDYHRVAAGYGGQGLLLERRQDVGPVLAEALRIARSGSPVLVNAQIGKTAFRKGSISM